MNLGTWLLSLMQPLAARILSALGFSVVTIGGMSAVLTSIKTELVNRAQTMPVEIMNVFLLAGGGIAMGIVVGALTTKMLLWQLENTVKILGNPPA